MTRTTLARVAGAAYLFYAAIGIGNETLMHQARSIDLASASPASIGVYTLDLRLAILIVILEGLSAFVLAVALYGLTRVEDQELAALGLVCRAAEGLLGLSSIPGYLGMLWLARAGAGDPAVAGAVHAQLLMPGPSVPLGAVFFAVGGTIFSYLLLRGRMVPAPLAWLGVLACGMLMVALLLQLAGFSTGPLSGYVQWVPVLIFQTLLALWLLIKGVAAPRVR